MTALILGLAACGDVLDGPVKATGTVFRLSLPPGLDVAHTTILATNAVFDVMRYSAGQRTLNRRSNALPVGWVNRVEKTLVTWRYFIGFISEDPVYLVRPLHLTRSQPKLPVADVANC